MEGTLTEVFKCLTGSDVGDLRIFRKHNNKLDVNGDVSFPVNVNAWRRYVNADTENILEHAGIDNNDLVTLSKNWDVPINKCELVDNKVLLFVERGRLFKQIINDIEAQGVKYGTCRSKNVSVTVDATTADLTQLRLHLLKTVTDKILEANRDMNAPTGTTNVILSTNNAPVPATKIVCGFVTAKKCGQTADGITADDLYKRRTTDMRLIAQHKYGLRVTTEPGWMEFFERLGKAAVTIELLHVKPSRNLIVNVDDPVSQYNRGASFILYNCARISNILKEFDRRVASNIYPALTELGDVNFTLLNQPEEWEILYVYLLNYPSVVNDCVQEIPNGKLHIYNICVFLDALCSVFSVYYRRVRILMEPRSHLVDVLHARIHFLRAIQQVVHNSLNLLSIEPVSQM